MKAQKKTAKIKTITKTISAAEDQILKGIKPKKTTAKIRATAKTISAAGDQILEGEITINDRIWPGKIYLRKWITIWQAETGGSVMELVKMGLTGREYDILMVCFSVCKVGNVVSVNKSKLAIDLGISRQTIHRTFSNLQKYGIITEFKDEQDKKMYRLNPRVAWFGSPHIGEKEIDKSPKIYIKNRPNLKLVDPPW